MIVILAWILSFKNDADAQQCTDPPTLADAQDALETFGVFVNSYNLTCAAISTEQPPFGSVYYREAAAIVSFIVDSPDTATEFVQFECSGTSWTVNGMISSELAPPPTGAVDARMDCYRCGIVPGSDTDTLCSRTLCA